MLVSVHKQIVILRYPFHTAQGTVAVIIELLVQRRPLINFHQADVGNKEFQLILGQIIDIRMKFFGLLKIHAHKSTKAQIIGCFRFSLFIEADFTVGS